MADTQIRQWVTNQDGIENLVLTSAPMPSVATDEVLVKILTVSLNYRDTEVVMGLYGHHKSVSQDSTVVPCSDICGTITDVGSDASSKWKTGQRVLSTFCESHLTGQIKEKDMANCLGLPLSGVLTEYRAFKAHNLVAAPDFMTDEEACTLPIAALTAWMSINGMRPMGQPAIGGTVVLIQGTGGVSVCGLQIAHAGGLKTIITSSSDAKLQRAKQLGADHTINYRTTPNWQDIVLDITDGLGADIIFECGGAQTLRKSFDCVAFGGLIDCIGYLSGKEDDSGDHLNTNVLALRRNVTLKGILNGPRDRFEEMVRFYEDKQIKPVVDRVFPFVHAKQALQYLFAGGHFGKVVVRVAES